MTHFSKALGSCVCASVLAAACFNAEAQTSVSSSRVEDVISISVISASAVAGTTAHRFAKSQTRTAVARSSVHSTPVFSGSGDRLITPARATSPTLAEITLRGTQVGDVIRLEYVAGTEPSLAHAVQELRHGKEIWSIRAGELESEKVVLTEKVAEARRVFNAQPDDEASRGLRYRALVQLQTLEKKLLFVERLHADADMRMHAARGQFAAADKNLQATRMSVAVGRTVNQVNSRIHIIQDVYVDGRANQLDSVFNRAIGDAVNDADARRAVPHVRIVRIQMPNPTIVSRAVRAVRAGSLVAGLSAVIVVEELVVGAIAKELTQKAEANFSPQTRTEPTAASGRRQ